MNVAAKTRLHASRRRCAGGTTLLQDAIASLPEPADNGDLFVWAGCEFSAFKAIRNHVTKHWKLARSKHLVTSYWGLGSSEDGAAQLESTSLIDQRAE